MKKESQDVITEELKVEPIEIDSSLFSAQVRKRLYWTNIPIGKMPNDKNLFFKDIVEKIFIPNGTYKPVKINSSVGYIQVGIAELNGHDFLKRVYSIEGKCPTLTAVCGGNQERKIALDETHWRKISPLECERLQTLPDNYSDCVSNSQRNKMIGNGWTVDVVAHIFNGLI